MVIIMLLSMWQMEWLSNNFKLNHLTIAVFFYTLSSHIQNITQARVQSSTPLEQKLYILQSTGMKFPSNLALKLLSPVYEIPETGLYWYQAYVYYYAKIPIWYSHVNICDLSSNKAIISCLWWWYYRLLMNRSSRQRDFYGQKTR